MGPILEIDGVTITKKEGMKLSIVAKRKEFELWQRQKLGMKRSEYTKIDWDSQHAVMAACNKNANRFAVRYTYHWLPSGKRIKMNNPNEDDRCPLCGEISERSSHFLRCKHRAMEKTFADMTKNIRNVMYENKASMITTGKILENLVLWRKGEKEVKVGRGEQNKIGWENFLHGRIAMEMCEILPCAGEDTNPEKAKRLLRIMIQAVFTGAEAMWRTRCDLAAGTSEIKVSVSRKMKQQAKVAAIMQQFKRSHVASLVEATVAQIMSKPDGQIESWIRTNESLIRRMKKDTGQRTISEFFPGRRNQQEGG